MLQRSTNDSLGTTLTGAATSRNPGDQTSHETGMRHSNSLWHSSLYLNQPAHIRKKTVSLPNGSSGNVKLKSALIQSTIAPFGRDVVSYSL